jgi:hypothetical protein
VTAISISGLAGEGSIKNGIQTSCRQSVQGDHELNALFAQAGAVISAEIIKDRRSGESKGFAFITMGAQSELDQAISMFNAYSLGGNELKVSLAKPKV